MDFVLYKALNGYAVGHDGFEDPVRLVAVYAQFLFVALLAGLFLLRGKWHARNGRRGVLAAGASATLALAAAHLITEIWARPRPYEAHPGDAHLFIPASHDPSFPSDHATAAFAIAVALLLRNRRAGVLALVFAVSVSLGRVVVGTHYPGDVLAGAVLGASAALLLWLPPIRRPLDALADRIGALYEGLVLRATRAA